MSPILRYNRQLISKSAQWEKRVFANQRNVWGLLVTLLAVLCVLIFVSPQRYNHLLSPDLILLILTPQFLIWCNAAGIRTLIAAQPPGDQPAKTRIREVGAAVGRYALRIWILILVTFKLLPVLAIAPYELLAPGFWIYVTLMLCVHLSLTCLIYILFPK